MATKEKTVNYTEAQTAELKAGYLAVIDASEDTRKETLEAFAAKFGKTYRSIVAKLSKEGVYKAKEYVSKTGEKPIKKGGLADAIGKVLLMNENEISSLESANKTALEKIFKALANSKPLD